MSYPKSKIQINCSNCDKVLFRKPSQLKKSKSGNQFCNNSCHGEWMKKDNHPNWNGGVTYHNEGYRMLFRPEHPNCNQRGYVYEHRLVMEKKLGRYLHTDEVVDHLNGNKTDNTLKNLFLTNQPEHMRRHYDNRQIDSLGRFFIK